ncbi:MAG: hypothetical protein U0800_00070 [Isosphaeraceae bacterium]
MNFVKIDDLIVNLDLVTMIRERRKANRADGTFVRDGIRLYFARDHHADVGEGAADQVIQRVVTNVVPS